MPGKKQLRKFSDDVLKIGDEVKIRASRGEKPAVFPVPDDIPDVDDSQDFVLGMPDPEDESHAVPNSSDGDDIPVAEAAGDDEPDGSIPLPGDEDLAVESDIPDLSDILNSIGGGDLGGDSEAPDAGIIGDLSGDISGDLGTDSDIETLGDDSEVLDSGTLSTDSDDFDLGGLDDIGAEPVDDKSKVGDAEAVDAEPASDFASEPESNSIEDIEGVDDLGNNDSADLSDDSFELPDVSSTSSDSSTGSDDFDLGDLNFDDLGTDGAGSEESAIPDEIADNVPGEPASTESLSEDIPATEDVFGGDFGLSDIPAEPSSEDAVLDDTFATDTVPNDALSNDGASSDNVSTASMPGGENTVNDTDDFGIDDLDFGDFNTEPATGTEDTFGMESPVPTDNAGEDNSPAAESFDLPDDGDAFAGSSDVPDMSADDMAGDSCTASDISSDFADMDFGDASDESFDAGDATASAEDSLGNVDLSALDDMDFGMGDSSGDGFGDSSNGGLGDGADASSFDDIEIKDTDENFGSSDSGDDFELGGDDDFLIPGFSDTQEADFSQHAQKEVNPVAVGQALAGEPKKDSLTEEEYEKFKKNLSGYPLNVKIAIEEMIANNDFTEDAIFEVIDKVIKKTQARQLAIYLEKILDISLPVPRDFEHRTVEEYEAYKASFEYQLKNRIIPLALITIGVGLISTFLFMCGKHYIYRPLKAESLYRQGYALLQADEYPQSEQKFKEAVHYRNSKKWFYRYARGYREHKQYERAAVMYDDILKRFKNDKPAGLEYAQMEWQDLSNYEGAVRLLNAAARRRVVASYRQTYHAAVAKTYLLLNQAFAERTTTYYGATVVVLDGTSQNLGCRGGAFIYEDHKWNVLIGAMPRTHVVLTGLLATLGIYNTAILGQKLISYLDGGNHVSALVVAQVDDQVLAVFLRQFCKCVYHFTVSVLAKILYAYVACLLVEHVGAADAVGGDVVTGDGEFLLTTLSATLYTYHNFCATRTFQAAHGFFVGHLLAHKRGVVHTYYLVASHHSGVFSRTSLYYVLYVYGVLPYYKFYSHT